MLGDSARLDEPKLSMPIRMQIRSLKPGKYDIDGYLIGPFEAFSDDPGAEFSKA